MNILVNSYCNLSCEYCFAKKMIYEYDMVKDMSLDDFKYCLDILEISGWQEVRLLGGEPTRSKFFKEYIDEILQRDKVKAITIFSNGILTNTSMDIILEASKYKQVYILLNVNSPKILGDKYKVLEESISKLVLNKVYVSLGVNLYNGSNDYTYILNLAEKYKIRSIRWALVSPSEREKNEYSSIDYYKKNVGLVMQFLRECYKRNIKPGCDCNKIPLCIFDDKQLREIVIYDSMMFLQKRCLPVIDVMPNLQVIRCFGTSDILKTNLRQFKDRNEIEKFFINNVDKKIDVQSISNECKSCTLAHKKICGGGCLAFNL